MTSPSHSYYPSDIVVEVAPAVRHKIVAVSMVSQHMDEDDDAPLELSADTLQALAEFRQEKSALDKKFEDLKAQAEDDFDSPELLDMDAFEEDWNASQFWYTNDTANTLAHQLLAGATAQDGIAVVSTPSVFVALKKLLKDVKPSDRPRIMLLEYDQRFAIFKNEFQPYDYTSPLRLPAELKSAFTRIICDPPFLNEDCQTKTALTARFLARTWVQNELRFISCTGERMATTIHRLYEAIGVHTTTFEPEHKNGLSNEFYCYANFSCEEWKLQG